MTAALPFALGVIGAAIVGVVICWVAAVNERNPK